MNNPAIRDPNNYQTPRALARSKLQKELADLMLPAQRRIETYLGTPERGRRFIAIIDDICKDPAMSGVNPRSVFTAAMNAVRFNVEPNTPAEECALIRYGDEVKLHVMVRGLLKVARERGGIQSLSAHVIYEGEDFEWNTAEDVFRHAATIGRKRPEGEMIAAYAVGRMANGALVRHVMPGYEVLDRKAFSLSKKRNPGASPWTTHEAAMWRKTAARELLKLHLDGTVVAEIDRAEGESFSGESLGPVVDIGTGATGPSDPESLLEPEAPPATAMPAPPLPAAPPPAREDPPVKRGPGRPRKDGTPAQPRNKEEVVESSRSMNPPPAVAEARAQAAEREVPRDAPVAPPKPAPEAAKPTPPSSPPAPTSGPANAGKTAVGPFWRAIADLDWTEEEAEEYLRERYDVGAPEVLSTENLVAAVTDLRGLITKRDREESE
jgi:phage RecT family recombinase